MPPAIVQARRTGQACSAKRLPMLLGSSRARSHHFPCRCTGARRLQPARGLLLRHTASRRIQLLGTRRRVRFCFRHASRQYRFENFGIPNLDVFNQFWLVSRLPEIVREKSKLLIYQSLGFGKRRLVALAQQQRLKSFVGLVVSECEGRLHMRQTTIQLVVLRTQPYRNDPYATTMLASTMDMIQMSFCRLMASFVLEWKRNLPYTEALRHSCRITGIAARTEKAAFAWVARG
jgi:hypothetical protein